MIYTDYSVWNRAAIIVSLAVSLTACVPIAVSSTARASRIQQMQNRDVEGLKETVSVFVRLEAPADCSKQYEMLVEELRDWQSRQAYCNWKREKGFHVVKFVPREVHIEGELGVIFGSAILDWYGVLKRSTTEVYIQAQKENGRWKVLDGFSVWVEVN